MADWISLHGPAAPALRRFCDALSAEEAPPPLHPPAMWGFWRSRDRFSVDEFRYLHEQLQRIHAVTDSNKEFVIETLRSMAELLIWGDQHDPAIFEFFMEKQVLTQFAWILTNTRTTSVAIQLLQTLNIIIQNMRSVQAIYYLFSSEHINNLITYPFNFENEELLAHFISFLRTISTKLDKGTISFFAKTENGDVMSFPLYSEAIKFAHHEENMVRIAVRTLTLNIYQVEDESIRKFILSPLVVGYFSDLVTSLRQQMFNIVDLVTESTKNSDSSKTVSGKLEEAIAEVGDHLYYCNDIINAGIPDLSHLMNQQMLNLLVIPILIPSLGPFRATGLQINELCSLYLFSCLLQIVECKELVNGIALELLKKNSLKDERGVSGDNINGKFSLSRVKDNNFKNQSSRESLLSYLFCENEKLVLASLSVLVALLQNKALDEALLDALGILPQRKQYKKQLLQALVGSKSDEGALFSPSSKKHENDITDLISATIDKHDVDITPSFEGSVHGNDQLEDGNPNITENGDENKSCEPHFDSKKYGADLQRNRYQVLDALLTLLCRKTSPCSETLSYCGWLLRQLLPYHGQKLRKDHLHMLSHAHSRSQEEVKKEIGDCWCDLLPAIIIDEWKSCKKALETSSLEKDLSFLLLSNMSPPSVDGDTSSFSVGERMHSSVKVFVILHQLQTLVRDLVIEETPQLEQPTEEHSTARAKRIGAQLTLVKRDVEIELTPGDAIPCRIAFEKGKERSVYLMTFSRGTSGWILLAEDNPMRRHRGVVRVIASLAGSSPRIDVDHPKWLHLRIRSPHYPTETSKYSGGGESRQRPKRAIDGRWTLAFSDEQACQHAKAVVEEEVAAQSSAIGHTLQPLLNMHFPDGIVDSQDS